MSQNWDIIRQFVFKFSLISQCFNKEKNSFKNWWQVWLVGTVREQSNENKFKGQKLDFLKTSDKKRPKSTHKLSTTT